MSQIRERWPPQGLGAVVGVGGYKKAATAVVFQGLVLGVASTIAVQGDDGTIIANQAVALNTDQVIINAAITYVNGLGGGSVFVDESVYTLGAPVAVLSNVFFYGSGTSTIITIAAGTGICIEVNGEAGWKIAFLTAMTTGAGAGDAIALIDADNGEIFGVTVDDSGNDGISIDGDSDDNNIHDNKISGCARYGINLAGGDNHVKGNRIDTTGDDGIWIQDGAENNIVGYNRVSGWVGEAIDVDDLDNEVVHNVEVV